MPKRMINYLAITVLWLATSCQTFDQVINQIIDPLPAQLRQTVSLCTEMELLVGRAKIIGPIDDGYATFSLEEWKAQICPPTKVYRNNAWDCDDMALECMVQTRKYYYLTTTNEITPAIGVAAVTLNTNYLGMYPTELSNGHALCVIYVKGKGWTFYEAQNGQSDAMTNALRKNTVKVQWVLF